MKNFKHPLAMRIVILVMVFAFLPAVFASCAKNPTSSPSGTTSSPSGTTSSPSGTTSSPSGTTSSTPAKTTTAAPVLPSGGLLYWAQDYSQKTLNACMDMLHAKYPGITIKTESVPYSEMTNKLMLQFNSGAGIPDICTYSTYTMPALIRTGQLMDITARITPYINQLSKMSLRQCSDGGKYYAVPLDAAPTGIIYNTAIFKQAGLDTDPDKVSEMLSTWDKYIEVGKNIKVKTGASMTTLSSEKPQADMLNTLVVQQGNWYNDNTGKLQFNIPETKNAIELLVKMKDAGILLDVPAWTQPWYDAFNNRKIAAYIGQCWMGGFMADSVCPNTSGEWRVVPMPMWKEGGARSADCGGSSWFISKQTKNLDAAWAVMEFYTLNEASVLKQFEAMDQFPCLETTYTNSFFNEPMAFFGGQPTRKLFAELEQSILSDDIYFSVNSELYRTQIVVCLQKVLLNNMDIDKAITEAEAVIKLQMQ